MMKKIYCKRCKYHVKYNRTLDGYYAKGYDNEPDDGKNICMQGLSFKKNVLGQKAFPVHTENCAEIVSCADVRGY